MTKQAQSAWWPERHPELVPFVPLALAIWRDGVFSVEDHETFCSHLDDLDLLGEPARAELARWMDPVSPPDRRSLVLLRRILRSVKARDTAPASLVELGLSLIDGHETRDTWSSGFEASLTTLQDDLGFGGSEQVRALLARDEMGSERSAAPLLTSTSPTEDLDHRALARWMAGSRADLRDRVLNLMQRSELRPLGDGSAELSSSEYRERTLAGVQLLADEGVGALGYPLAYGGSGDPGASVAVFETLAFGDLSILVKFGVQFGLFGGSVAQLGTERHHRAYLERIGTLQLPGCYAMTETGHGSNVRDLETIARYEHATRELVLQSPTEDSGKDWIGNAACHGQLATVFARLIVDDEDHGVHAMLVPIRQVDGTVSTGVRIEDRGLKLGLNGVDNGRIWFKDVRIPVENLLDRFAAIDAEGAYQSPIASDGRRFFTMLRTLVAGRVSIAAAAVSASKSSLTIGLRYVARRRQFGPSGAPEAPILTYSTIQKSLLPRLATTYGLHFASRMLQDRYEAATATDDPELEVLAAGLKAYASDHCVDAVQAAREACGGQGYLSANAFGALKADTDVFTTFEGANLILCQLVAKGLLSRYRDEMGDLSLRGALRYLGERAETSITELNPVQTRRTESDHLRDVDFHLSALRYREERVLRSAARRMRARLRDGMDSFDAVNEVQVHLVALANAHVERVIAETFADAASEAPAGRVREVVERLRALHALSRIEADRGWFLETGYIEGSKSRAIRSEVSSLCREVALDADLLTAGFGIPDGLLPSIAQTQRQYGRTHGS
jgi:acyl-CoA oxidase